MSPQHCLILHFDARDVQSFKFQTNTVSLQLMKQNYCPMCVCLQGVMVQLSTAKR